MKIDDLKKVLEDRGWRVDVGERFLEAVENFGLQAVDKFGLDDLEKRDLDDDKKRGLVPVEKGGLFKCVDGRFSDQAAMRGPKALGGVYAIASMNNKRTVDDLQAIVREMKNDGKYTPCVHGDTHGGPLGCGYFKLWKTGQLPGLQPPKYDGDFGRAAVLAAGGVYEGLVGAHEESFTVINLKKGTTLEPRYDAQRFVLDAWIADEFEIDLARYAVTAAETVERLRPAAMHAVIVEP